MNTTNRYILTTKGDETRFFAVSRKSSSKVTLHKILNDYRKSVVHFPSPVRKDIIIFDDTKGPVG